MHVSAFSDLQSLFELLPSLYLDNLWWPGFGTPGASQCIMHESFSSCYKQAALTLTGVIICCALGQFGRVKLGNCYSELQNPIRCSCSHYNKRTVRWRRKDEWSFFPDANPCLSVEEVRKCWKTQNNSSAVSLSAVCVNRTVVLVRELQGTDEQVFSTLQWVCLHGLEQPVFVFVHVNLYPNLDKPDYRGMYMPYPGFGLLRRRGPRHIMH